MGIRFFKYLTVASFACTLSSAVSADSIDFPQWFALQQKRSLTGMFANIAPTGTSPGVVIASPSKSNPDYYFHWVRDAALVMNVVADFAQKTRFTESRDKSMQLLHNFAAFSRQNQITNNRSGTGSPDDLSGLGEPKFRTNGAAYDDPWGRPQTDGPALRAITLIKYAEMLLKKGQEAYVRENLYDGANPSSSVIKNDLEYVSRFWRARGFDLWEEVNGYHFYTRMVQRKALLEGARFADTMKDPGAAKWYRGQVQALTADIKKHFNPNTGRIHETLFDQAQLIDKPELMNRSGLDAGVILGVLHGDTGDGYFGPTDDRVLSTAYQLKEVFKKIYPINHIEGIPGVAIGRYPEDSYDAGENKAGNPWFLTTLAFAELFYKAAADFKNQGQIKITVYNQAFFQDLLPNEQVEKDMTFTRGEEIFGRAILALQKAADAYLLRVAAHSNRQTGSMAEQFHRQTGEMKSAADLTWSYAAFITASWARPSANEYLNQMRALGIDR